MFIVFFQLWTWIKLSYKQLSLVSCSMDRVCCCRFFNAVENIKQRLWRWPVHVYNVCPLICVCWCVDDRKYKQSRCCYRHIRVTAWLLLCVINYHLPCRVAGVWMLQLRHSRIRPKKLSRCWDCATCEPLDAEIIASEVQISSFPIPTGIPP